jgi:hypothetical protein
MFRCLDFQTFGRLDLRLSTCFREIGEIRGLCVAFYPRPLTFDFRPLTLFVQFVDFGLDSCVMILDSLLEASFLCGVFVPAIFLVLILPFEISFSPRLFSLLSLLLIMWLPNKWQSGLKAE